MTEGRDSHYQPWLRDDAEAKGRPIRLQERLDQARIARGGAASSGAASGGASAPASGAAHASDAAHAEPGFEYAPRRGDSLFDDDDPPLGLDLDGYYRRGSAEADRPVATRPEASRPEASRNDHMGDDYYAAARAARDASAARSAPSTHHADQGASEQAPVARQRMRLNAVRLDGGDQAPAGLGRADYDRPDHDRPKHGHLDRVPGDMVAPLRSASDGGDSWGDLAAKSGRKAMGGIKNGWNRFADWTIDLGARADVPARVAALRLDEKAKAAAAKTAELSKNAAAKTAEASKVAASKTAEVSRNAAAKTAELSKGAAAKTAEISKGAAAKTAATAQALTSEGKERVGKLELGSKFGDVAGKAGDLVKQGASSVADATKVAGGSVAGAVSGAVSGVAGQVSEKTSQIGLELGRAKVADPASIPSALEQLLAEEQGLATPIDKAAAEAMPAAPEPVKREAPALPLFAEVPETVPTQIAPKRGSAITPEATLFDADPKAAAAASAAKPEVASQPPATPAHKPLIIMPGESDMRDHNPAPEATKSAEDEAVIIPVKPREPSAFAQRWMETKDRLGDRWAAFQAKPAASGEAASKDSAGANMASDMASNMASGGGSGSTPPPTSAALGGLLTNSKAFVGLGSLLIAGAMYSAAGALPPRGLSQEIGNASTPPLAAAGVDRSDRAEIEAIVHDYILEHPEIVPQALERYQAQQMAKQIDGLRSELETPFAGAWTGAAKGDVVLVEFSDFACGYCRASVNDVERLLKDDPKLKVVHRELPILSPESGTAAKTALAAAKQGKYRGYYLAQFALGRPSPETIEAASKKAGLDPVATQKALLNGDIQAEIDKNMQMAQQLSFSGTPTFIVGDRILQGAVGYDELKKAVAEARAQ